MKYIRQFGEKKQKDDFIAKIQGLILQDSELGHSKQLDYQELDGFRKWLYYTPKFSPSGFVKLTEIGTLKYKQGSDSLKSGWEITIETA